MKKILIIAGSDSGGGAGIQADIKTACAHNVFATTAITAITAQNTQGVQAVEALSGEIVEEQIKSVVTDIEPDAVKIGMLANADIIKAVIRQLGHITSDIILDPVMAASSGDPLLDKDAINELKSLAKLATLITPNIPEAEILAEMSIHNVEDMIEAAKKIHAELRCDVLLKGGHMSAEQLTDVLLIGEEVHEYKTDREDTKNTHGTGCTLSSAVACNLANGLNILQAVQNAKEYVQNAIVAGLDIGEGDNKPLNHSVDIN